MDAFVKGLVFWACCLPAWGGGLQCESNPAADSADAVRRLAAEFESAQSRAFALLRNAKSDGDWQAANQAKPDRRKFAQRFLDLTKQTDDEAAAVDALVWVVRNAIRTPEADEAVRQIADYYCRSDRIGAACHALGARGPESEVLLKRIFEENPNPGIRGRACLALASAMSSKLRVESRAGPAEDDVKGQDLVKRQIDRQDKKSKTSALAVEIEHWLRQVAETFPDILLDSDITDKFGLLSENLGPAAGQILLRIAEAHPQPETRFDAECGLASQQMAIASLVADLRSVAAVSPESKQCGGPEMAAACVFGGEARLNAVDSKALVREIEQRLQRIADHVNDVKEQGICYRHLIMDSPTLSQFHAGTETVLRVVAEGHPDKRFRAGARRSLAIYLAALADLSRTIDSGRISWINRLGAERVEQIRRLDAEDLMQEARAVAEEVAKELKEAGSSPDPKIEGLRKVNVRP